VKLRGKSIVDLTCSSHATRSLFLFLQFFRRRRKQIHPQANNKKTKATMGGRGNPHLQEKKKYAQCYLRATFEQGGAEALAASKPQDCWSCHPTELAKGNYTTSAWGSLFARIKKDAEQEAGSSGQLSSFPQYAAEDLPDRFKSGTGAGAGMGAGAGTGTGTGGTGGAATTGTGSGGAKGSPADAKKGK
jgi:hypothetical protein